MSAGTRAMTIVMPARLPGWFVKVEVRAWMKDSVKIFLTSACSVVLVVCFLSGNGNNWPKITKNADFGPNVAVFGPKSLIFMGLSKSFGTNITENHFGNLSALFFGHALDQVGQKCRYLAQNASFGPNLAVFGPQIQFFGGRE